MSSAGNRLKKLADKHPGLGLNLDSEAQPASAGASSAETLSLSLQPENCVQFKILRPLVNCVVADADSRHPVSQGNGIRCSLASSRQGRLPSCPEQYGAGFRWYLFPAITGRRPGLPAHSP